jgi:hypothetical protein
LLLVATGGSDGVLDLNRRTREFPEPAPSGAVTASGVAAIAHLEAQRGAGAEFLLVPSSELWRLDEDRELDRHLRQRYPLVHSSDSGMLFDLRQRELETRTVWDQLRAILARCERELDRDPAVLDWKTGLGIAGQFPELAVFSPLGEGFSLPYPDETIDVVTIPASASAAERAEAWRVAQVAVTVVPEGPEGGSAVEVDWKTTGDAAWRTASVIVPCQSAGESVRTLLVSLRETLSGYEAEIVVAHDAAALATVPALRRWEGVDGRVRLVEVESRASPGAACNAAASSCESNVLVFLTHAACLLPEWLTPLMRIFRERPDAGAVGAKVLTFHGELLHAGSELLPDGSTHTFGRGADPNSPVHSCVRPVDFISPALLATSRELFAGLGGFGPGVDSIPFLEYCARLGARGRRVYYQPETVAVLPRRSHTTHGLSMNGRHGALSVGLGEG